MTGRYGCAAPRFSGGWPVMARHSARCGARANTVAGVRGCRTAELFVRIDNRDNAEISVCEHCADTQDVSYCAD